MKIKDYKLFLESNNKEEIDSICKKYNIRNYIINDDFTIDVDGCVDLSCRKLTEFPLKFGKVTGSFNCNRNQLNSLDGSPNWVGTYFTCDHNQLTSLVGSPKWIGGYFSCEHNQLKTLEGSPNIILSTYYCGHNKLVNFKGFPEDFNNIFVLNNNPIFSLLEKVSYDKWLRFIYWCNELNVIDDNGNVNEEWMEEVYYKIGLK